MSLFLLSFQYTGQDYSPFLKFGKYIVLAIGVFMALRLIKKKVDKDIFIKGISAGTKLGLIAGLVLAILNIILFYTIPEYSFSKYNVEPNSLGLAALISAILFFETLVAASIISFIFVQYMKNSFSDRA